MATQNIDPHNLLAAPAGTDLTSKQFTLVKLNSSGQLVSAVAGDTAFVLQDKPKLGQSGTYAIGGRVKAVAGGNFNPGELLSSDASGHVVKATVTVITAEKIATQGTKVIGYALEAGATGDVTSFIATPTAGRA